MSEAITAGMLGFTTSLENLFLMATDAAGNMSRVRFSPFAKFTAVDGKTDLNDYENPGLYRFSLTQENQPCNMAGNLMLVWSHTEGYAFQLVFGLMWSSGGGLFYRMKSKDSAWYKWRCISGVVMDK